MSCYVKESVESLVPCVYTLKKMLGEIRGGSTGERQTGAVPLPKFFSVFYFMFYAGSNYV